MTAAELVGALFLARDVAHRAHLATRSYARHKALEAFYHGIIERADAFSEAYQGRHELLGSIPLMSAKKSENIVNFLQSQVREIEAERFEVCGRDDTPLQNLIDEIIAVYLAALYQLRFLA